MFPVQVGEREVTIELSDHVYPVAAVHGTAVIHIDKSYVRIDRAATGMAPFHTTFDYFGTARARLGYAFGSVLPYVTGGIAWRQTQVEINDNAGNVTSSHASPHVGWTAGAGVEFPVSGKWTGKVEYNYIDLGSATLVLNNGIAQILTVAQRFGPQ